ncbi:hypothetical protein [Thermosulfurimonas sp.]|uniref:hypothetical protein n=1 Tax=Thermosulfurimonas sp. TaxID=2080236 RepID=UPI0025EE2138|nr:hypothetical protein [Thermosulfurimonas sp.]
MIRQEVQEEAELIVHEGGEIPEVAFWNAWFYLTEKPPQGLGLVLEKEEELLLRQAVIRRYLLIIQRDLTPEYIGKSFYRGPVRARVNWQRLCKFLKKHALSPDGYREKIRGLVRDFLARLSPDHPLREPALHLEKELEGEV